jgi:hypothetical protein
MHCLIGVIADLDAVVDKLFCSLVGIYDRKQHTTSGLALTELCWQLLKTLHVSRCKGEFYLLKMM